MAPKEPGTNKLTVIDGPTWIAHTMHSGVLSIEHCAVDKHVSSCPTAGTDRVPSQRRKCVILEPSPSTQNAVYLYYVANRQYARLSTLCRDAPSKSKIMYSADGVSLIGLLS